MSQRFNWAHFPKTQQWVDEATIRGKPITEIVGRAKKLYQDEGGIGYIDDKIKVDTTTLFR
jgi:hypothetical protein